MSKKAVSTHYAVFCCGGSDCMKHGGKEAYKALKSEIKEAGLKGAVTVTKTHCSGLCKSGPIMVVCSGACVGKGCSGSCGIVWYQKVDEDDARDIVNQHLRKGQPVERNRYTNLIQIETPEEH